MIKRTSCTNTRYITRFRLVVVFHVSDANVSPTNLAAVEFTIFTSRTFDDIFFIDIKNFSVLLFQLNLDFYDDREEVDLADYVGDNELSLVSATARKNVKYYPCCEEPYPDLTFEVQFEKQKQWWQGKK